jgi:hypothetical protein
MSQAMTVPELLAQLKRWHVDASEAVVGGKRARDHYRPGAYGNMHGLIYHHTGPFSTAAGMASMIWHGRSDLPGPLAHATAEPNGHVIVTAGGRANHAGMGAPNVRDALLADRPAPAPGADAVDGNAILYGLEIMSTGARNSVYPDTQVEASVRFGAAIFEHHGWKGTSAIRHAGWTTRKVDTAGSSAHGDELTQDFWQREVDRALAEGPDAYSYPKGVTPPAPPNPEDPVTPAQLNDLAELVVAKLRSEPLAVTKADATGADPAYSKTPDAIGDRAYSWGYWQINAAVTIRRVVVPLLRQIAADVRTIRDRP